MQNTQLSSDDDDFEFPTKRHSSGSKAILKELREMKENMASFFKLSSNMMAKRPTGLF